MEEIVADVSGPAAVAAEPAGLRGTTQKMSMLRRTVARRMVESLQTSAQLTTVVEADVTALQEKVRVMRPEVAESNDGLKLTLLPFICLAAAQALRANPVINASVNAEKSTITYHDVENLAIAVQTSRGLAAPVIRGVGDMTVIEVAAAIADVATRAREGRLGPEDFTDATFTVSNTGSRGALFDTPIINQPNVAILGTGSVVERPVAVRSGEGHVIAVRSMMYLALSYDHRIVDGADAAAYLTDVKQRLS
jgi:2-oxoglutarate dehydrogenase E2 component (dihydrolipoamide succinyltransferase)